MITFDAAINAEATPSVGPLTWSHTTSGSNRLLLVGIHCNNGDLISAVTYSGVSMTQLLKVALSGQEIYIYGLLNPALGTNTVSVTWDGSNNFVRCTSASYIGVLQTGLPDATQSNTSTSGTSLAATITTIADNCWVGGFAYSVVNGLTSVTNGTTRATGASSFDMWVDSNAVVHPAGGYTMTANFGSGSFNALLMVSFAPATESPSTSASASSSPSKSASASVSASASKSLSPSASLSPSRSASASASRSSSASVSSSLSPSASGSSSLSASASASQSVSSSTSASPSEGFADFTRDKINFLPGDDIDLATAYTEQKVIDVSSYDGVSVGQAGSNSYMIHLFKVFISDIDNDPTILCRAKSTLAPSTSPVYLQIYNRNSGVWQTIDSNDVVSAGITFRMAGDILNFNDYIDSNNVVACRVWQAADVVEDNFVVPYGSHFYLSGERFRFLGVDSYDLFKSEYSSEQLDSFFSYCASDGIRVVGTFAYGTEGNSTGNLRYISGGVLNWREAGFVALDRVIDSAHRHGIKLVFYLTDQFSYGPDKLNYVNWSNTIYGTTYTDQDSFHADTHIKTWFKEHIYQLINRVNTISGITYKNDVAIFSWAFGDLRYAIGTDNNPNTISSTRVQVMKGWISEMASYIKSLDSNHMVGIGGQHNYFDYFDGDVVHNSSFYGQDYKNNALDSNIDYFEGGLYPWGLQAPWALQKFGQSVGYPNAATAEGLIAQINQWVTDAKSAGKPFIVTEIGVSKDNTDNSIYTAYPRSTAFNSLLNEYFSRDTDGILIWSYSNLIDDPTFNIKPDGVHVGGNANGNSNDDDTDLRTVIRSYNSGF